MKRRIASIFSALLFVVSLCSLAAPAQATARSSDYFAATAVWGTALGSGKVQFDFDINATHQMLEVGAKKIYVCEQQSDGKYAIVKTYSSDDNPDFINTNSAFGDGYVVYQGTAGIKYYALFELYARDSSGSETLVFDTKVITAK